jgi:hypothetical protein
MFQMTGLRGSAVIAAAPPRAKPAASTDTAKGRRRPKEDTDAADRGPLKRKRPSQPSMATSSAIKGQYMYGVKRINSTVYL